MLKEKKLTKELKEKLKQYNNILNIRSGFIFGMKIAQNSLSQGKNGGDHIYGPL